MKLFLPLCVALLFASLSRAGVLQVSNGGLSINGQKVFLSGPNLAWKAYGYDFGNGMYDEMGPELEQLLQQTTDNGGNAVRIWIHVEGDMTPQFDSDGYITAPDDTGTIINDLRRFLDKAQSLDIVVILCLWNGAYMGNQKVINMIWDDSKLQSYIDNALIPIVSGLAGHAAIGAWEIMNEPEGSVIPQYHPDPCADMSGLEGQGPNWSGANIPMERMMIFLNWQLDAIAQADPSALRTVGSWSEKASSDVFGVQNFYKDECLIRIGGRSGGTVSFYQIHTYDDQGTFLASSPLNHHASDYGLDKPVLLGEFSSICGENRPMPEMFDHVYFNGYIGGLTWMYYEVTFCGDTKEVQNEGYQHIRYYNDPNNGGLVDFDY